MEKNIDSGKFINQVTELYAAALAEAIALLKNNENGRYIAIPNWEDEVPATSWNDVPISIWGVGLNDDEHTCFPRSLIFEKMGTDNQRHSS